LIHTDVIVAGAGVAGLLIGSEIANKHSVVLLEQGNCPPTNKYWLTDENAALANPELMDCVDRRYDFLDFVAFDGFRARIRGRYCLWNTDKLVRRLSQTFSALGGRLLTDHRLYTFSETRGNVTVRANSELIQGRLLVDCMGFGSPIVGAKDVSTIVGYYIIHGLEVEVNEEIEPVGLDNILIHRRPSYFELFPTSRGTAHAAIILPSRDYKPDRSIKGDLHFILNCSHYKSKLRVPSNPKTYFGFIPVGRLRRPALDRIVFYGEAGQVNPATSATGLSRMLHTYRQLGAALDNCLERDALDCSSLLRAIPLSMTRMNRAFQETLFEQLLSFNSDDFRRLIQDLHDYPDDVVNDLIFASFDFRRQQALRFGMRALLKPRGILGPQIIRSIARFLRPRGLV
jgi:flavin-dependent dehydrogenase